MFIPSLTTSTTVTDALVIDSNNFVSKRVLPWALDSNNNIYRQNHNVGIGTNNPSSAKLVVQNTSSGENILKLVGVVDGSSNKGVEMNTDGDIIMSGNLTIEGSLLDSSGNPKTFIIDHPLHSDKYLVHATLEGPEAGVYYRGKAQLQNGKAVITLPDYFESLTHEDNRTIQLNSENGWSPLFVKGEIKNGQFLVQTTNKGNPSQRFNWVVTAERKDVPKLEVEPLKSSIKVHSFGPYTYSEKLSP